jgi:phosphoribosylglycinamide formyltransferase 1
MDRSTAVLNLGVLVSGSGTNLQAILDAVTNGSLDACVRVVVSNKSGVGALERAERAGVVTEVLSHRNFPTREQFDTAMVHTLRSHQVDTVVLAGFMRIVTPVLLDAFPHRVINIHPSLLPAFPGVDGQAQAWARGVKLAGCTVHFVDSGTDTGPIIAQAAVPVFDEDSSETLRARILCAEHKLLPAVLQWISEGRVSVTQGRVKVDTQSANFAVYSPALADGSA